MHKTPGFCALCATDNVKIYENTLIIEKNSYPMKIEQNIFIPHEDVAKYFGTPLIHSAQVPGIKDD